MDTTRRGIGLVAAGAAAALAVVSTKTLASPADEAAVTARVEELREATFKADKAKLEDLAAASLSYGHSSGTVETKAQFIAGVMNRTYTAKSLAWPDMKVAVTGNTAIVRHRWESVNEEKGKTTETKIGVLQVWQKFDGKWQIYARQAFRLPAPA